MLVHYLLVILCFWSSLVFTVPVPFYFWFQQLPLTVGVIYLHFITLLYNTVSKCSNFKSKSLMCVQTLNSFAVTCCVWCIWGAHSNGIIKMLSFTVWFLHCFSVCFNGSKPLTNNTLIVNDLFIITNISEHCSFPCRKSFS